MVDRDALILEHRDWATRLAVATVRNRLLPLDHDDAVSAAMVALVVCADRWQPGPATFRTYATRRIIGSVYDELRRDRWWSGPRDDHDTYRRPASLASPIGDGLTLADVAATADGGYDLVETVADLVDATVTGRERTVLELLSQGLVLAEVGERLGVSMSRVSQIRRAIYDRCYEETA